MVVHTGLGFLRSLLPAPSDLLLVAVLLVLSLLLLFAGKTFIKVLVFLVAGIAGAAVGIFLGGLAFHTVGAILGGALGFVVGGVLGIVLLRLGIGVALGYFGYAVTRNLTGIFYLALAVGVVLFLVGIAFANKLLELFTAFLGALLMFEVLLYLDLSPILAAILAIALGILGFWVQSRRPKAQSMASPQSK